MKHRQLRTSFQSIFFAKRPGPASKSATYRPPARAKFFLIPIGILITTLHAYCQISDEKPYPGNARYIETSAGTGLARLRDFATSPLYSEGVFHRYAVSLSRIATKSDVSTGFSMVKGNLKSDFNEHTAKSALTTFSLHHSRLYQILRSSPEQWNFKIGGEANVLGNLRVNRALMNSAVGIEAFPSLFGSFKVTRDITRQTGRRGKEPKKKSLSLRVNASLIGASFQNGYSYLGIGQMIDKSGIEGVLDEYRFQAFGVSALSSSLDYAASFTSLATKALDNVVLVGDTTGGGLGLPNGGQLPNGWTYRFLISQALTLDKYNAYENGVPADIPAGFDWSDTKKDAIIERAIQELI